MNWEAIGAVGELIGAVAVVVTLLSEPGGRAFWEDVGREGVHGDFRDAVEAVLESNETSYKIG